MISSEHLRVPSSPSDGVRVLANILHSLSLRARRPSSQDLFQALPLNLVDLSVSFSDFREAGHQKSCPKILDTCSSRNGQVEVTSFHKT